MTDVGDRALTSSGRKKADVLMFGLRSIGNGQGGVEAHVDNLVQELDGLGLSILVATRSRFANQGGGRGKSTLFVPFWAPLGQNWEAVVHSVLVSIFALVQRPRIVHVHAIGPSLVVPFLRLAGLKVVTTHHGEDYNREKWGIIAAAALRLGEWCQAMFANARICVSSSLAKRLENRYGRHFEYIPNGVRPHSPSAQATELERFGLVPGEYVLTVSRLVPEKRHLDLIEAFSKLPPSRVRLALVGGSDHASSYADAVLARARQVSNVIMTGVLTGEALHQFYSHAGVFALPSSHEGLPIALLEAMSFGRNVIASAIAANLDVGLPAQNYHKVGDIADLSRKLAEALADGDAIKNGRDWAELLKMFNWPEVGRKTFSVYKSVNPSIGTGI
ncbi:glycosyltransferase family 4 protein [Devosia faecipullorum]|uniref:glycosyltransferase family 4 protein n=1 Tax=Devosia faecipullorum TaxID=2755039 RepID=UPI00187B7F7F|nr:glycosyltransferase family 4 protein [Devosia faecipullorum]MBE7731946.1 glycosyltransferase family 4 protein [Devosia faecipullorum]